MAEPNLLECWRVWNAHHRKIKIQYPGDFIDKHEVRKLHYLIKKSWKNIGTLHPNSHGNLKRQFCLAVRRVDDLTDTQIPTAERDMNIRTNVNSVNRRADPPELHEKFYFLQLELSRAIRDLVRIERAIGEPAHYIRQYDTHRAVPLMPAIEAFPRRLAGVRRRWEGHGYMPNNTPGRQPTRSGVQTLPQPDRNIDHHPSGSMFYQHLDTSAKTTVGLWILTNENNNIVDRVVAKDCWWIEEVVAWASQRTWWGDYRDPTTKLLPEALIQDGLVHDSILGIRSWHMHPHKLMCRLLLEWCSRKSAQVLHNTYRYYWEAGGRLDADLIPEPAIWHIFETLIKAGLVMEQGAESLPSPPWFIGGPVVHMDIKPDNVFIGDYPEQTTASGEDPNNFAMYPSIVDTIYGGALVMAPDFTPILPLAVNFHLSICPSLVWFGH